MKPPVRSDQPHRYAEALDDLWERLATTLPVLETLARDPVARVSDGELLDALPGLQYALHAASEAALGIEPPPGAAGAHAEFTSALAYARDVTAEVAEAIELDGTRAAQILQWEWRGAIFRVRLARLRLAEQTPVAPQPPPQTAGIPAPRAALLALLLVVAGAIAVITGAQLDVWPVWAGGLSLSFAGVVAARTNP